MSFTRHLIASLVLTAGLVTGAIAADPYDISAEQPGRIHASRDDAAAAAIPAGYTFAEPGVLTVAVAPWSLPIAGHSADTTTVIGADADLAVQLAEALGLKLNLVSIAWADWPLGLASGKYDAVISNVGVTEERKDKFDFSTYRKGLHAFAVRRDNPITAISEPKDVAGLKVITDSGTIQEKIILEWSRINVENGLPATDVQYFDDDAAASLALQSGRADTIFGPNATRIYAIAQRDDARIVGTVSAGWPLTTEVGVTTRKDSGLAPAITLAINQLISGGQHGQTLRRWSLEAESIETSRTNPPGLPRP